MNRGGDRLSRDLRRTLEPLFDADLSDVRVHVGPEAAALGALAFARGASIHFAEGCFDPTTPRGLRLLGHEVTHVLQQRAGLLRGPRGTSGEQTPEILRCPALEAEADQMGALAAAALEGRRVKAAGRVWPSVGADGSKAVEVIQLQEKGVRGGFAIGVPATAAPTLAVGTVIFRQTASTNEVFSDRTVAFTRAKDKNGVGGNASRTYFSNAAHAIGAQGQETSWRFMQDRALNAVSSYGRYFEYDNRKLVVEHTDDAECRLIEITGVNAVNVTYRRWTTLGHFHCASYAEGRTTYHTATAAVAGSNQVQEAPPAYDLALGGASHHIYYLGAAPPQTLSTPRNDFANAFSQGAQALFTECWNW